ncbi:MAG: phosphatase domain-containing protein [Catalinimonas sp.]
MDIKNILSRLASNADDFFDEVRERITEHNGGYRPVYIQPYRGVGSDRELFLKGRVLVDRQVETADDRDTVWNNLVSMYKRFNSREVPNVRVQARFGTYQQVVTTDAEGYFEVRFHLDEPLPPWRMWYPVALKLLDEVSSGQGTVQATGEVQVAHVESKFGVISDMDDTVLVTGATNLLKMARLTFLNNARTRLPFAGVAAFYRALQKGDDAATHPLYYVSSSPWNLYDLLLDFCRVHGIPEGPLLLRDYGLDAPEKSIERDASAEQVAEHQRDERRAGGHLDHKLAQIKLVMSTTDPLPFLLIGDSGQKDPEIYEEVVRRYPGRVKAIYIRDVSSAARDKEVHEIAGRVRAQGVDMLLVKDTVDAAHHAFERGFIRAEALEDIGLDAKIDQEAPSDLEQILKG